MVVVDGVEVAEIDEEQANYASKTLKESQEKFGNKNSKDKIKTFSIGFDYFSELKYSKITAEYIESDHHELNVDYEKAINIIPKLVYQNDEPLVDFAAIPNYLLSEFAKKKVKVVMTGQGADELFAGYAHYSKMLNRIKLPLR